MEKRCLIDGQFPNYSSDKKEPSALITMYLIQPLMYLSLSFFTPDRSDLALRNRHAPDVLEIDSIIAQSDRCR
jgi:hypothetical protein